MDRLCHTIGTRVRLDRSFSGLPAGSEGVVIGYFRMDPPAYAIAVGERTVRIPPAYLVVVDAECE